MMKSALLLGILLFSFNVSAVSITDLNTALHKTNQKTKKTPSQIVYAGRDILKLPISNETTGNTQTEIS